MGDLVVGLNVRGDRLGEDVGCDVFGDSVAGDCVIGDKLEGEEVIGL